MRARVVFLGTPLAAIPTLEALAETHDVGLVITQPDRPKGRSKRPLPPPVKQWALEHNFTVAQPATRDELVSTIRRDDPFDVGVVVAYGRILRPEVLEIPTQGLVNVHFSLLPRWRGAAPVARALISGDEMTGVTIMKLDEGLDTGPILTAQAIDIPSEDDAATLTDRLARIGARLLIEVLPGYLGGEVQPMPQTDEGATYADKIVARDRPIDVTASAWSIANKVRGLSPAPAATLEIDGDRHKILEVEVVDDQVETGTWRIVEGRPIVGVGDGAIALVKLQPSGRRPQSGTDWANGRHHEEGSVG